MTDSKTCRICLEEEENTIKNEKWLQPCKCRGTQTWIHQSCLDSWIRSANNFSPGSCAVCHERYNHLGPWRPREWLSGLRWDHLFVVGLGLLWMFYIWPLVQIGMFLVEEARLDRPMHPLPPQVTHNKTNLHIQMDVDLLLHEINMTRPVYLPPSVHVRMNLECPNTPETFDCSTRLVQRAHDLQICPTLVSVLDCTNRTLQYTNEMSAKLAVYFDRLAAQLEKIATRNQRLQDDLDEYFANVAQQQNKRRQFPFGVPIVGDFLALFFDAVSWAMDMMKPFFLNPV